MVNRSHILPYFAGLYVVDIMARGAVQTVAVNEPRAPPILCVAWNTGKTGQTYLYASNGSTITAYRASSYQN